MGTGDCRCLYVQATMCDTLIILNIVIKGSASVRHPQDEIVVAEQPDGQFCQQPEPKAQQQNAPV